MTERKEVSELNFFSDCLNKGGLPFYKRAKTMAGQKTHLTSQFANEQSIYRIDYDRFI